MISCLKSLCQHKNKDVRVAVASTLNLPESIFEILSQDKDYDVLMALCNNPALPVSTVKLLLENPHVDMKFIISRVHNMNRNVLTWMFNSGKEDLISTAIKHPNFPTHNFFKMLTDSKTKKWILQNPNCPSNIFYTLSKDKDWEVRFVAGCQENCPSNIIMELIQDKEIPKEKHIYWNSNKHFRNI